MIATAVLLAVAALPSAASGDGRVTYVIFRAPATHGYELQFSARAGKRSEASVTVSRGRAWAAWSTVGGELVDAEFGRGSSSAIYDLSGEMRISARRVAADLGPLGSIDMRLEERGGRPIDRHCLRGRVGKEQLVGALDFEGEAGYAVATRARVRAVVATVRRTCAGKGRKAPAAASHEPSPWQGPQLLACGPGSGTLLLADRDRYTSSASALAFERTPYARIIRSADVVRPATDFSYRRDLTSAKLHPSPPIFAGLARYGDGATTGDLQARMPGRGTVPMTPGDAILGRGQVAIPDCPGVPGSLWQASIPALATGSFVRERDRGDSAEPRNRTYRGFLRRSMGRWP
jgi:hypothetical protein